MGWIQDFVQNIGFGTGANVTTFDSNGQMRAQGEATVHEDVLGALFGKSLFSTSGKVDFDWDELAGVFQSGGAVDTLADMFPFVAQYPHGALVDGKFELHAHWKQYNTDARQITIKHRVVSNLRVWNDTWVTTVVDLTSDNALGAYPGGDFAQITPLLEVDMIGESISAMIDFKIWRTDTNTGDMLVKFVDGHVEKDAMGSRERYIK